VTTRVKHLVTGFAVFATCGCAGTKPLKIAVVDGSGTQLAAALAVEDVNAAGGINGRLLEVEIVTEPEQVTPQQAIATADSIANDSEVLAVIGHGGSATSIAASQVYNARRLPQIAASSSSPRYTQAGPYSFRMVASDEYQGQFIAQRVAAMRVARAAVLYINDDYGKALNESLARNLRREGVAVVHTSPFIGGAAFARNVDEMIKSLEASTPDLLIWIGLYPELSVLRPRLRLLMPSLRVVGSDGVSFAGAATDLTPFEGDRLVAFTDVNADHPRLRDVARRFEPMGRRPLTDAAALTYDAVGIVAEAMRSGARTREDIQKFLAKGGTTSRKYDGITGSIILDENGDARPSYVMFEVLKTGIVVVGYDRR
jgi:branched-chain amino acid transport system substrate-binding protein